MFAYALPDELPVALGGLTDLDPVTGEARYVYAFSNDANRRETRHGFTGVLIHELGHFFGLSHTADGYDYASRTAFDGTGPSTFAAIGQYSGTVMQYLSNERLAGVPADPAVHRRDDRQRPAPEGYRLRLPLHRRGPRGVYADWDTKYTSTARPAHQRMSHPLREMRSVHALTPRM